MRDEMRDGRMRCAMVGCDARGNFHRASHPTIAPRIARCEARGKKIAPRIARCAPQIQYNTIFLISVHLSQGMRINYVHVHYTNFALIIVMNLTNFNNILTSRLLNSLCEAIYKFTVKISHAAV